MHVCMYVCMHACMHACRTYIHAHRTVRMLHLFTSERSFTSEKMETVL